MTILSGSKCVPSYRNEHTSSSSVYSFFATNHLGISSYAAHPQDCVLAAHDTRKHPLLEGAYGMTSQDYGC